MQCKDVQYDDRNKNGIKPYIFGKFNWLFYHLFGNDLNNFDEDTFAHFVQFILESPKDLVQCVHCRKSIREYLRLPEYNICTFMKSHSLNDFVYLIHNVVNRKLFKDQEKSDILAIYEQDPFPGYEYNFWKWIENIAFNYPADIQLLDYTYGAYDMKGTGANSASSDGASASTIGASAQISKYAISSPEDVELRRRMKTYILFFDLLKNFIRPSEPLFEKWLNAYFQNPPTPYTFSNRTQLLKWIYEMKKLSGFTRPEESFACMVEYLHPTRSTAF